MALAVVDWNGLLMVGVLLVEGYLRHLLVQLGTVAELELRLEQASIQPQLKVEAARA